MRRVILETPFASLTEPHAARNLRYARAALADSLRRGEAPFMSHLLYPQVLDDSHEAQRALGIAAGLAWGQAAQETIAYVDYGITDGMKQGIDDARMAARPVVLRRLYPIGEAPSE